MFTIKAIYDVDWYSLLYMISSLVTFIFVFYLGWKKGYPTLSWILIIVSGALFFIIGTKLLTFRSEEWTALFREGVFPHTGNKSAIGGLLFAILGIELSRSWLKIREFILDTYVLIVPLGLAIQKVGCLMAGCCFGTPTSLPWGIEYGQGTAAHYHQWISNDIAATQVLSLPVHPVPLYELLSYLMIFAALLLLAPYLQKKGSRFLLALALLALSRFTLEFFRDHSATVALGQMIAGLKAMQWALMITFFVTGLLFLRKLRQPSGLEECRPEASALMWRKFTLILLLSILIWAVHTGFSPMEMLVINLKLLPALILFGFHSWIRFAVPRFRIAGIIILALPLLIMGQSLSNEKDGWKYFHSFGVGGTFGSYGQVARYNEHEGGCNGMVYDRKYYEQDFGMATLNYSYTKQKGYFSYTFGGSIFGGIDKETEIFDTDFTPYYSIGIHPYVEANSRWFRGGVGASIGNLNYIATTPFEETSISSGIKSFPFLPSLILRVGPYDIIDFEYKFQDVFPTQFPVPTHQISLGSSFGMQNGSEIRIGLAPPEESFFVNANVLIKKKFMIQAKYMHTYFRYGSSNFFSFGLSYRLPASPRSSETTQGN